MIPTSRHAAIKFPRNGELVAAQIATETARKTAEKKAAAFDAMLEALRLADAALSGANMNMSVVEKKVRAAIAQAEEVTP